MFFTPVGVGVGGCSKGLTVISEDSEVRISWTRPLSHTSHGAGRRPALSEQMIYQPKDV